jgi:gliding motility-associated-like protein
MLNNLRLISLILFLAGANCLVFGQCTTGASFPVTFINPPLTTSQPYFMPQCSKSKVITTSGTTNQHSKVFVIAGYQYNFRSLSVGSAVQTDFITIADEATGAPLFSGLNGTSGIYWTATLTGVIRFYTHTSAGCPTTSNLRSREVIMAPFQAKLSVINSLCSGNPGTGQYTVTVGPNHGWNYTSLISPLNAFTTASVPAAGTIGTFAPRSYDIKLNGTSVNGNGSTASNPEICPNCPGLITNGTSIWTLAAPPPPYQGNTYISVTPIAIAGTNTFTPTNLQTQTGIGSYTSPATIAGNNNSNQLIEVKPSGTITNLAAYNPGCGAYTFYPTITAPPNLLFNQSGTTTYSCGGSGSVALSANGGTAPYNISWFNQASSTIVTSPAGNEISASGGNYTIPNLAAGTYTFNLTDANGCVKTILALIINPPSPPGTPVASVSAQPTCSIPTGTITVTSPVAASGTSYTLTGTNPVVAAITNTTGIFPNLASGTYQVISTVGGCASPPLTDLVVSAITLPDLPTVIASPATCSSNGTASISNYDIAQTYVFTPPGPTIDALGLISGMTAGINYTVISNIGACASSSSLFFIVDPQLITPLDPTISTAAATCSSAGTATISNYVSGHTYDFTPIGPTVVAGGVISGMTAGTSYTVTSSNGFCTSLNSLAFSIDFQLITPPAPTIIIVAPTCLANGTATISNFVAGNTYNFTPSGPTVDLTAGVISNMTTGTPYIATSNNGFCTSLDSAPFTIEIQLSTPVAPIVDTTATTCLSDGTATVSNYDNTLNYTFTPSGPTVDASGAISNITAGIAYTVTSFNGSCTSLDSAPFTIDFQLITPATPLVDTTAATCLLEGTATLSNYDNTLNYTLTPSGPTLDVTTGVISNITTGSPYTITSNNGFCSIDSSPFTIDMQLITPADPTFATLAETCLSDEIATISNYDNTLIYTFNPSGPTIDAIGLISNIISGTSFTIISTNGFCTSELVPLTVQPLLGNFNVIVDTTICSSNLPFSMNSLTFNAEGTQVANLIAANGCDSLVTINLTVIANDNSNFSQISPICFGDPLSLPISSLNGFSGTWSPAINNTDTTTYTFTPGIGQCGYTATMTIIVYPQVLVTITDTSICTGGTATLIATGSPAGGDYFWSNANETSSITVSPTFSTSYSVFYTSLNNCFVSATRLLAVNPIPTVTATSALICDGEIATIVATGLPTGGTYLWSPSGQATASINVSPNTTSNYSVVYSRFGCESPQVNTMVTVKPVPIVSLASEVICIGEEITMTAQTTIAGGVYDWGNGNANETQTFSPLSDTTLSLSYSVNGCTSPIETSTITVNPLPISTFSGSPLTGCIPLEVTLLADDNSNTSYSWSSDNGLTGTGFQSNLTFTSGGIYDITLIAGLNGCFTTTTMNNYVAVDNYPIASFVPSSNSFTELTQLLEFTNNSSGAESYSWDFGDGASSAEINPAYFFTDNLNGHVITLTAYSQFLCANVDSVEILFNNGLVYYIPNTFTPNGDEFNQTFKPIFSNSIDVYNYSFYIYNRWGHVIFETHDVEKGWDGLFGVDGIPVPQGTYTFKIIVKYTETDERKEFFGHVNVAR